MKAVIFRLLKAQVRSDSLSYQGRFCNEVPTVNRDNNQHSPNENIRFGNYVDGIKTIYYILKEPLSGL